MAECVLFNIAEEIVKKLGPLGTQEIALWWGVKDQLSMLMSTVTRIKGVLQDAEEQVQKPPAQLEDWLGKLQEAVYDAEDLLDDFSTEVQRKRLMSRNKIPREGWWKRWSRDEMNDDSDESTIEEGLIMLSFPRLSSLSIGVCPNLTSMPLFPTLDEDLYLDGTSSMPLQQTMKMTSPVSSSSFFRPLSKLKSLYMHSIDDMESLPEVGLQNLSSLQWLSIMACSRLKSLPLPDQGMHSLQKLEFTFCQELKSLSESESQGTIPYLPSLQELIIIGCSGRTTRWGKKREEEWPNIKHIPYIEIGLRILDAAIDISYIFTGCNSDTMIGLGFDKVEKACDKLDRNLFTLHTLHIHFICKTKLQSKSLIQSQMVESSVHSGVVLINQTPNIHINSPINWSLTDSNNAQACWLRQTLPLTSCTFPLFQEYYPTRESARSLEDEGLRCSTVLMNFNPTKLDHDVYGLKGCLQGFNWPFATRYMLSKQFTVDELNIWRAGLSRSATLVSLIIKKPTSSGF
ncbi:hypothetical protein NC653_017946 [Populus alba x Populus x berolinensis]|uniref:Disease resistance N-terminal domain-containing protein n=1 Tax=Populus alba x Populus x berolinensis TaxID=444605 RepID=A0AAD6QRH9_9ROSI|nr:hypothetical protein NC653_017946 [Populus alba x Populus x berolinensis]